MTHTRVGRGAGAQTTLLQRVHTQAMVQTVLGLHKAGDGMRWLTEDTYGTRFTPHAARLAAGAVVKCVAAVVGTKATCNAGFAIVRCVALVFARYTAKDCRLT